MGNPFLPYLPMYRPGALPERPWWVFDGSVGGGHRWTRHDHATVLVDAFDRGGPCPAAALAGIDAYDTAHPLPVPPPMVGQVWVLPDGEHRSIIGMHFHGRPMWGREQYSGLVSDAWEGPHFPRPRAVLVLGPTPWGRDRPWAPPGWRA